jgi:flagellar biosynthesis/type III secretory pathway chaperone
MTKKYDKLNEVFNVSGEIVSSEVEEQCDKINNKNDSKIENLTTDIRKDYNYVRGNMYSIVEKGQEALNSALELAQETDSPRAYEVVGQLIKNISDSAEKIIELQKKIKDIEDDSSSKKGPTNVTNALFVGSTAELSKLLKNKLNDTEDK